MDSSGFESKSANGQINERVLSLSYLMQEVECAVDQGNFAVD